MWVRKKVNVEINRHEIILTNNTDDDNISSVVYAAYINRYK